jgi:hypothetical protein
MKRARITPAPPLEKFVISATPETLIRARQILVARRHKKQVRNRRLLAFITLIIAAATAYGASLALPV